MNRKLFLHLTVCVFLCASLSAAAQKFLPKAIQFKGDPEYSDQELLSAAGLQKGTVLNYADMESHTQKLMDTGVFNSINFKFDGVDLIYTLIPATTLYPIRLENLPLAQGKEMETALHERLPLYHGKVPSEGGLMESVRGALEEMLVAQGVKATVEAMPFSDLKLHKVTAISYSISSPLVQVGAIHLEGVSAALQAKVKLVANHESGTPFDAENSGRNIEHALELFYEDKGYAAVKVHAFRSGNPLATAKAIEIPFSAIVEEGRSYKLGAIHLLPNALVTQAEINKIFGKDDHIVARGKTPCSTWFIIASRYKAKGYLDCAVTTHPEFDEASSTVNYTMEIEPGAVYHLAFVKFENVSDALRSHLMRVWQMLPGDIFDESYVANFIITAEKEDPILMRSLDGVKISYDVFADQQTHEVNCVIHFKKAQQAS
jgi:outer membrane protein assembly factor BamA